MTALAPGDVQLTPHFRLSEFAVSATHPDLVRPVPKELRPRVQLLAEQLERVRAKLQRPMRILSGYRAETLNKAVRGSATSQHTRAEAADVEITDARHAFEAVLAMIEAGELTLGQVIWYPSRGFIHFALPSPRYPTATPCVHEPSMGLRYRAFRPQRAALAALVPQVPRDAVVTEE